MKDGAKVREEECFGAWENTGEVQFGQLTAVSGPVLGSGWK